MLLTLRPTPPPRESAVSAKDPATCTGGSIISDTRTMNEEIRCNYCKKKLAEGIYQRLSIKCPRCKAISHYHDEHQERHHTTRAPQSALNKGTAPCLSTKTEKAPSPG